MRVFMWAERERYDQKIGQPNGVLSGMKVGVSLQAVQPPVNEQRSGWCGYEISADFKTDVAVADGDTSGVGYLIRDAAIIREVPSVVVAAPVATKPKKQKSRRPPARIYGPNGERQRRRTQMVEYACTHSVADTAVHFGVNPSTVYEARRAVGINRMTSSKAPEVLKDARVRWFEVVRLILAGTPVSAIADKVGLTKASVWRVRRLAEEAGFVFFSDAGKSGGEQHGSGI